MLLHTNIAQNVYAACVWCLHSRRVELSAENVQSLFIHQINPLYIDVFQHQHTALNQCVTYKYTYIRGTWLYFVTTPHQVLSCNLFV